MKTKLFTLFLAFVSSIGSIYADYTQKVSVGDLYYLLDEDTKTAKVTYQCSSTRFDYTYYNITFYTIFNENSHSYIDKPVHWSIQVANIPATIVYNEEIYDVISIGEHAFQSCDSLRSVSIPSSITSIESNAFASCYNLTSVHIADVAAWCAIQFNGSNPLNIAHNLYVNGDLVTDLVIPDGVIDIPEKAFYNCSSITSVIVPNSVTRIGSKAFYDCPKLRTAVIGKNVSIVADDAFVGSTNLISVTLNSDSIVGRNYSRLERMGRTEPLFGDSVETYIIGEGVKNIGNYVFGDCRNLKSVRIPNSVTSIGEGAFDCCKELCSINIPNSITTIGASAFWNCTKLASIDLPNNIVRLERNIFAKSGLISITIPNSVTYIGVGAFHSCESLTSIEIPNSVKYIDDGAFASCLKLASIEIPNSVTNIGLDAFCGCENLVTISIPDSVTSLQKGTFQGCKNLISVSLSENITTIGSDCFSYCYKLDSLQIPNNVKSIGRMAFYSCKSLSSIELSDSLEVIGDSCFFGCTKLYTIIVPAKVKTIGFDAFSYGVKEIILLPLLPPVITVPGPYYRPMCCWSGTSIYVPCGSLDAYMSTEWSNHNIQYQPNTFDIKAFSVDSLRGEVTVENNSCLTLISATPYVGNVFVQWSDGNTDNPRTITLTQDTTITAIFATQTFTVTFVDDNDTILSSQEYEYGSTIVPPPDPIKTNDAQYTYTFAGWSPQFVAVTSDATYKATYQSTINRYSITFMSEDSVLFTDLWEYGTTPVYRGSIPTKIEDERYTYTFNGWSPEIVPVVADATYTATFKATEKSEALEDVMNNSSTPTKYIGNGTIYILMPNGMKYSIIGEHVK